MRNRKSRMFRNRSNGRNFRHQGRDNKNMRLTPDTFSNGKINFKPHQSVEKLLERYKLLAKEALTTGDKTLAENYLQHADHFERMVSYKNSNQNGNNLQTGNINKERSNNLSPDSTTNQSSITKNEE